MELRCTLCRARLRCLDGSCMRLEYRVIDSVMSTWLGVDDLPRAARWRRLMSGPLPVSGATGARRVANGLGHPDRVTGGRNVMRAHQGGAMGNRKCGRGEGAEQALFHGFTAREPSEERLARHADEDRVPQLSQP